MISRDSSSPAWRALEAHHQEIAPRHLRELFANALIWRYRASRGGHADPAC